MSWQRRNTITNRGSRFLRLSQLEGPTSPPSPPSSPNTQQDPDICSWSPVTWLLQTAPPILHPTRGYTPFLPRQYQTQLLLNWEQPARLILKSRQTGFSQAFAAEAYWTAAYRPPQRILVVSRKEDAALEFLRYVREFAQADQLAEDAKTSLTFRNGSRIKVESATRGAGRSYAASRVYLDEFAHAPWALDIYQAVRPTIATGGTITIFSSPNGRSNIFYQLWAGLLGIEQWRRYRVPWNENPDWDAEWEQRERAAMTVAQFAQEYDCDFVASGAARFAEADVLACFRQPVPESLRHELILTADPAGAGKDSTAVQLWDVGTLPIRLVREERWARGPFERFYRVCTEWREQYKPTEIWVDATGLGSPMVEELSNRVGYGRVSPFVFTARSKEEAMAALVRRVERHELSFDSEPLRTELLLSQPDDHDLPTDSVMAAAIMAAQTAGRRRQTRI